MKNRYIKHLLHGVLFAALFLLVAVAVMLLWNWLIPAITGWTVIGYWQALGLMLLTRLLLGGGGLKQKMRNKHVHHAEFRSKLQHMSREERKAYIKQYINQQESGAAPSPKE